MPPTGFTAQLTLFSAGAMAFLAVFALALALATGRLADRWSAELAGSVTVRVSAPAAEQEARVQSALTVLQTTPGAGQPRRLPQEDVAALLEPWFGPDMPVDALPVPALIDLPVTGRDFDTEGLRLDSRQRRLARCWTITAPGGGRWSRPRSGCACWGSCRCC